MNEMEGERGKKMDVTGIICEYDPFHLGHKRQFDLIRQSRPNARIVCLMSGCFTQRGMPALYAPAARAKAALLAGADMVLELPCAFSVRDAEHFALGGVLILSALGFVDTLCFGAEDALSLLQPLAALLEAPDAAFTAALRRELGGGASHAAAQGRALAAHAPASAAAVQKPNNILALCYLRALLRLHSPLKPMAVERDGDYRAKALEPGGYPSAAAVRAAVLAGERAEAEAACGYALPLAPLCMPDALDKPLLYALRAASPKALTSLPLCNEGLENRLLAAAKEATSREELLWLLKTRRYPYARLSRLCCHALLGVTQELLCAYPTPAYVRLLGIRKSAGDLLRALGQSAIPVVSKAADGDRTHPLYALDIRAYDLWALGAGIPAGLMPRSGVATV